MCLLEFLSDMCTDDFFTWILQVIFILLYTVNFVVKN